MIADLQTVTCLWPELALVLLACCLYVGSSVRPSRAWWAAFSLASYAVVAGMLLWREAGYWNSGPGGGKAFATGPILVDYLGYVFRCLALMLGALFTMTVSRTARRELAGEYLGTLMLLVAGLMLVARANDLVLLFVSLELVSIPTYVLLYLGRRDRATWEATVKYFFLSILASALFLYGASFLYGLTGTTAIIGVGNQAGIGQVAASRPVELAMGRSLPWGVLAFVLIFAGLGFKIAAVPFHFYAPDVYQGANNPNAGLLSVAPKVAGILAIVRLLVAAFPLAAGLAWQLSLVLALLTMTIGNVCALWQSNIRRLMAYSSVAHAGYLLIGFAVAFMASEEGVARDGGVAAVLFYLFVYAIATLGVFAALTYLGGEDREVDTVEELSGLGRSEPMAAAVLAVCLFSLAGIPPLAGFWGKLALFLGAIRTAGGVESPVSAWFAVLAVGAALNAAIAAAYYLRVIAAMYFRPAPRPVSPHGGWGAWSAMCVCALLLLAVGAFPRRSLEAAHQSELVTRVAVESRPASSPARDAPAARGSDRAAPPLRGHVAGRT